MLPINLRQFAALVLVLLLASTHYVAYQVGHALEEGEHAKAMNVALSDALKTERENRALEKQLRKDVDDGFAKYQDLKKRSAAAAVSAAGELRELQEALAASAAVATCADPSTQPRTDETSKGRLLLECATRHQEVATGADALADQVTGLQGYVRVVLKACGGP